jgi:hypothetical protein
MDGGDYAAASSSANPRLVDRACEPLQRVDQISRIATGHRALDRLRRLGHPPRADPAGAALEGMGKGTLSRFFVRVSSVPWPATLAGKREDRVNARR